jgi:aminoglycoside 6'-N-acetyltransferase
MRLRDATPADIPLLRTWDEAPHVVASGVEDWDWEAMLATRPDWRALLIAEKDGRPVGFLQIIDPAREDTHYWGACGPGLRAIDIWIGAPGDTGRGLGTAMMQAALARCFAEESVSAVLIDPLASNAAAHRFYRRLGFIPVGPRRFGDDECLVFELTRAAWRNGD